jgi:hypothetical protein
LRTTRTEAFSALNTQIFEYDREKGGKIEVPAGDYAIFLDHGLWAPIMVRIQSFLDERVGGTNSVNAGDTQATYAFTQQLLSIADYLNQVRECWSSSQLDHKLGWHEEGDTSSSALAQAPLSRAQQTALRNATQALAAERASLEALGSRSQEQEARLVFLTNSISELGTRFSA